MKLLTRIANLCGTDKGTTNGHAHGYTEFYEDIFNKFLDKEEVNILEIGVFKGDSLKMYDAFFDGKCNIYGIDIEDKTEYDSNNIKTFICDQGSREELQNFKDSIGDVKFDLIIDDGSHFSDHEITSLFCLHDLLKKDGFYIIEDLHTYEVPTDGFEYSIIFPLVFRGKFNTLTDEENEMLHDKIDVTQIWCRNNENLVKDFENKKSITCVITFKN